MDKDKIDEYEDKIVDIDEISGVDIKINPDYYIHSALLKAQKALVNENIKEGFAQFKILIEHIESLCRAAKMIDNDYTKQVSEFEETKEIKEEKDPFVKMVRIANKKLELLMTGVFDKKIITDPLKA